MSCWLNFQLPSEKNHLRRLTAPGPYLPFVRTHAKGSVVRINQYPRDPLALFHPLNLFNTQPIPPTARAAALDLMAAPPIALPQASYRTVRLREDIFVLIDGCRFKALHRKELFSPSLHFTA